jgi:hypothetical protein
MPKQMQIVGLSLETHILATISIPNATETTTP